MKLYYLVLENQLSNNISKIIEIENIKAKESEIIYFIFEKHLEPPYNLEDTLEC